MSFFVKCINASGYNSGLIEDSVYKVLEVTEKGNFILEGATPPEPFTSFEKTRFAVVDDTPAEIEELDECVYKS
jgi:hypothetical protein